MARKASGLSEGLRTTPTQRTTKEKTYLFSIIDLKRVEGSSALIGEPHQPVPFEFHLGTRATPAELSRPNRHSGRRALVETELPRSVGAAALPIIPVAEGPATYQAQPLENSEAARSSVPRLPVGEAPVSAAGVASSTEKVPGSRSAARTATLTSPSQTIPALRSKARTATLTPPSKTITTPGSSLRTGTLTPPSQTVPAQRSTRREATLTPPLQTRERLGRP
jgi:hypothetical protein